MNCIFDIIYTFDGRIKIGDESTADIRLELCKKISEEITNNYRGKFDLIAPIPETGKLYSEQIAAQTKIQHKEILTKEIGRKTFSLSQSDRFLLNAKNFNVDKKNIHGKRILLVDETIVTGQTFWLTRRILLRQGAASVTCALIMPPVRWHCPFGKRKKREIFYNLQKNMTPKFKFNLITLSDEKSKEITSKHSICDLCHF